MTAKKYEFDVEVSKVLNLMINSLYTNKDVALRELISNSSDACDKIRYLSSQKSDILKDEELKINLSFDKKAKTFSIEDNGIGMNEDDLKENLGTIAKSGTENFVKSLTGENKKDVELIGQFGVGFYSAFMIADEVTVESKKYDSDKSFKWHSTGAGNFEISDSDKKERGTKITLHLKKDEKDFLDVFYIKNVIKTYSDHINVKIEYKDEKGEVEVLNSASALWAKSKSEISKEEYENFYKNISHLPGEPYMTIHNKAEGAIEYTNLLFIPGMKPFDLFHPDRKGSVKLYVKKVFISEDLNLVPAWLRFMRGLVDSEDLPLNISRESLQYNLILEKIKKAVIKKVLSELEKKAKKDEAKYLEFWNNFGAVFKEGLCESNEFKDKILNLSRFYSLNSPDKLISLKQYLENAKENQDKIYFLTGESVDKIKDSPQLEGFADKNVDVLFLTDAVDDFWVTVSNTFEEKEFCSATRADIDLDGKKKEESSDDKKSDDIKDVTDSEFDGIVKLAKEILGEKVKDVKISSKLTSSPVCLAVDSGAMDIRMERYLKEQNQLPSISAKILEINPNHAIIKSLQENLTDSTKIENVKNNIKTLFDQACISAGEEVIDVKDFTNRLNKLMAG
ncbi:molecular chaperone HtpG [Rickettsiales bacterium]|nr:molecular chaperone HtpG [Rickettsiales bacterium]